MTVNKRVPTRITNLSNKNNKRSGKNLMQFTFKSRREMRSLPSEYIDINFVIYILLFILNFVIIYIRKKKYLNNLIYLIYNIIKPLFFCAWIALLKLKALLSYLLV